MPSDMRTERRFSSFVAGKMNRVKNRFHGKSERAIVSIMESLGYCVARRHAYDSVLPSAQDLKLTVERWNRPSCMGGVAVDLPLMEQRLAQLCKSYKEEFDEFNQFDAVSRQKFGPGYTPIDALVLYMMLRELKPARYIEIGSGVSTWYCSMAAERNKSEGKPLAIECIEPYPGPALASIPGIEVKVDFVQAVERSFFKKLRAGDVLFIDSSHVVRIDGDVPYLMLEILPELPSGVFVHIHDIPFPYNTPFPADSWVFGPLFPAFWNEAMLVQAFLCYNSAFQTVMSLPFIRHTDREFLVSLIPEFDSVDRETYMCSSLWLQKIVQA